MKTTSSDFILPNKKMGVDETTKKIYVSGIGLQIYEQYKNTRKTSDLKSIKLVGYLRKYMSKENYILKKIKISVCYPLLTYPLKLVYFHISTVESCDTH